MWTSRYLLGLCLHKTLHYVTMLDKIYHSIAKQLENDTILKMKICICKWGYTPSDQKVRYGNFPIYCDLENEPNSRILVQEL